MPELFDTKYFRGQGPVYIGTRTPAGEPENLVFIGDLGESSMEADITRSEIIENTTGQGGVGSTSITKVQYNLNIMMRSAKPPHLALALHGVASALASAGIADQAHIARPGKFLRLLHVKVNTVTVTGPLSTPIYTPGTDYVVHGDEGMVEILTTGTIADGATLLIDYAFASQNHVTTNPNNLDRYIVFSGKNTANNNKQTRCELYKVRLDPGALALITSEETEYPINGRVLLDSMRPAGDQFFKWKLED